MKLRLWFAAALVGTGFATDASAQSLRVRLVDSATAIPLRGALVALLDVEGRAITEVLTSQGGFGDLDAPPGAYRLRVRRIGYEPYLSGTVRVPRADRMTVAIGAKPVVLSSVRISARSKCARITSETGGLRTVWDEVTKALQASRLSLDDLEGFGGLWKYETTTLSGGGVEAADTVYLPITNRRPFAAISPGQLARVGYVEGDETLGWTYYGPDETVLLSPEFDATHCFNLERNSAEPDMIGIAFRPIPSRKLPDIAGVAWVDQRTSELRRITFGYVHAGLFSRFGGGGETRFERLASGAWLVSAWHLRAPTMERVPGKGTRRVGFQENGGGILSPEKFQARRAARPDSS